MKKIAWILLILFASTLILGACSNDKEKDPQKTNKKDPETTLDDPEESEVVGEANSNDIGDQLDLHMGDTGKFDTILGSYDMTLESAKLVEEVEGEKSTRDGFIILDLTIKNTGNEPISGEDIIVSMEVTNNLEHTGSTDHAAGFDTMTEFEDDLQPGEEQSGHFLTIVDDADTYFFRKMLGNVGTGSTNQVIWTIQAEEAK